MKDAFKALILYVLGVGSLFLSSFILEKFPKVYSLDFNNVLSFYELIQASVNLIVMGLPIFIAFFFFAYSVYSWTKYLSLSNYWSLLSVVPIIIDYGFIYLLIFLIFLSFIPPKNNLKQK